MTRSRLIGVAAIAAGLLAAPPLSAEEFPVRLSPARQVELGSTLSGTVATVSVRPGQRVNRGEPLVDLDARALKAAVAAAKAQVEARRLEGQEADRELERALDLYDRTLLSEHERLVAENGAALARSRVLAAEAELLDVRVRLEQTRIQAPFDGWVVAVPSYAGQAVVNRCHSTPLVELASTEISAVAELPPGQAQPFAPGTPVRITVDGDTYTGSITHRAPGRERGRVDVHALFTPASETRIIVDSATMALSD